MPRPTSQTTVVIIVAGIKIRAVVRPAEKRATRAESIVETK
jgi:hypothetical protein